MAGGARTEERTNTGDGPTFAFGKNRLEEPVSVEGGSDDDESVFRGPGQDAAGRD